MLDDVTFLEKAALRPPASFFPGGEGYQAFPTRPLAYASFALNYFLGGLDTLGYHLVNLAVHATSALLVYALVLLLQQAPVFGRGAPGRGGGLVAPLAALLFAVHPIQTEAVTYIVQRLSSLATLFFLAALVSYLKARLRMLDHPGARSWGWLMASWCFALAATKTKEIAFTLPVIVVLVEACFFFGPLGRRVLVVLPYALIALLIPLALVPLGTPLSQLLSVADVSTRLQTTISRWEYLCTELRVLVTYLRLLLVPVGQNLDYDYPLSKSVLEPAVLGSLGLLLGLCGAAAGLFVHARRRAVGLMQLPAFGLAWFFVTLSVESSVIPIVDVIFEHRLYLPSVGALIALGALSTAGFGALEARGMRAAGAALLATVVVLLAGATVARNRVWSSTVTLWEDVVRKSPAKARTHFNLGNAYAEQGRPAEAIEKFQEALRLRPDYAHAWNNLGAAHLALHRITEARQAVEEALKKDSTLASAWQNLGQIELASQRPAEAMRAFERATELAPAAPAGWFLLGRAHALAGRPREAVRCYLESLRVYPEQPAAWINLAAAYQGLRSPAEAEQALLQAVRLSPANSMAWRNLGVVRAGTGRFQEAAEAFRAGLSNAPSEPELLFRLGLVELELGNRLEAQGLLERLQGLEPRLARELSLAMGNAGR